MATRRIIANFMGGVELIYSALLTILEQKTHFDEEDKAIIRYSWLSIRNDVLRIIILGCIAGLFHQLPLFICFFVSSLFLRIWLGGVHCKTFWGCLGLTGALTATGMGLAVISVRHVWEMGIITVILGVVAVLIGPIQSRRKKLMTKQQRSLKRIFASISVILLGFGTILLKDSVLKTGVFSGMIMETMQVILIHFSQEVTKHVRKDT